MATENQTIELKGSCLCGEHSYKATGQVLGFYHCHCERCRKTTGSGHASNILLKPGQLELQGDASKIGNYKVPEASRFSSRFCKECGGPVPRFHEEMGLVVVQAGTLDEEPDVKPECRIFWDSRANWSCSDQELPTFTEYPTKS